MTTQSITLEAETRSVTRKKVKALRRQGFTPTHLYGKGTQPMNLQVDSAVLQRLVVQAGRNIPTNLSIKGTGGVRLAFIREVQRHPMSEAILHVDFYQVPMAEVMRAQVPIYLTGEAPAVRVQGGVLSQALHSIEVECLPLDVPQYVELDISGLEDFEQAIYVSGITLEDSVTLITNPSEFVARVNAPRVVIEPVAAEVAEAVPEELEGEAEEPPTPA